jgi:hypothetical protein
MTIFDFKFTLDYSTLPEVPMRAIIKMRFIDASQERTELLCP